MIMIIKITAMNIVKIVIITIIIIIINDSSSSLSSPPPWYGGSRPLNPSKLLLRTHYGVPQLGLVVIIMMNMMIMMTIMMIMTMIMMTLLLCGVVGPGRHDHADENDGQL